MLFTMILLRLQPYKSPVDYSFAVLSLVLLAFALQLRLFDPFSQRGIVQSGLGILMSLEVALFCVFLLGHAFILRRNVQRSSHEVGSTSATKDTDTRIRKEQATAKGTQSSAEGVEFQAERSSSKGIAAQFKEETQTNELLLQ